ncbi:extracellular solute-binding protein [Tabrizicola oligotrophica]|uniref:ABC transporter substrate-binding protein n=1 Tax=Tabrizicola oligotrophica TaxID=2710650 RepID=A0A6M0QSD3_9RHOB|nr:extracellular solute-binding protein [Tabrizicola oligotrophica]NEY89891.1 ABC transporter substrate-binding protein [Tabrizicola oligotrophica]
MRRSSTAAASWDIRAVAASGLLGIALAGLAGQARAEEPAVIVSHGISTFGELKLPADFPHLPYVNPKAPKGGEISQWAPGTFDSVNPYTIKGVPVALGQIFFESILSGTADEIGAAYCKLCETMEYPEDRSWVIFNLRKDVTFSDGTPMTAEDVVFSYELFRDKGIAEFRSVFNEKFQSVEALDPYRVKFTFTPGTPFRDMPATAGGLTILSKADYEGKKRDLEESTLEPFLGTGPYVLDSIRPGQQVVYKRDEDYWGAAHPLSVGQFNFDRIRVEYFGDDAAALEGFKSGDYTFRNENSSKNWATAYDFPGVTSGQIVKATLPSGAIASGQAFLFNLRRETFQDPRVRQAIGLMFNFEWSNQTLFYGLYQRINSIWENTAMAASGPASPEETALLQPLIDEGLLPATILTDEAVMAPVSTVEKAMDRKNLRAASALLDEAGWTVGEGGLRRNARGETLKIEFLEDSPSFERVISPYVENLRALGVDAQLVMVDSAQLVQRVDPPAFDFDIIVGNAVNSGYEPGAELKQAWASVTKDNSTRNRMGYANPAVDRLLDLVEAATTREELDVVVQALDRVLRSERIWVPQWYKAVHTVAYYDMYEHPETLPPYGLGELDFWWLNPEKEATLRAVGALK